MAEPTAEQRRMLARMGLAMPDGSFYIRNGSVGASDLKNAIDSVGRGESNGGNGDDIRKYIMRRATALKLENRIPPSWNSDGSLKHVAVDDFLTRFGIKTERLPDGETFEEFIRHFGVKGMHWGVRKNHGGASSGPSSEDHAKVSELTSRVQKHGTKALNNDELKILTERLNLESQFARLTAPEETLGKKAVNELLDFSGNVAKQQAKGFANKYAAKGIEHLIAEAAKSQKHRSNNAPLRLVSIR